MVLRDQIKHIKILGDEQIAGLEKELAESHDEIARLREAEIQQQRGHEALSNRARLAEADGAFKALYKAKEELKRLYLGSEAKRAKLRSAGEALTDSYGWSRNGHKSFSEITKIFEPCDPPCVACVFVKTLADDAAEDA